MPRRSPHPRFLVTLSLMALGSLGTLSLAPSIAAAQTATTAPATSAPATTAPATSVPAATPAPAGAKHSGSKALDSYLEQLHAGLGITAAEEPLWSSFAQTMRANAHDLGLAYRARRVKLHGTMTALDDLNSYIVVEQTRLDGLKRSSAAFTALYAQMAPAQQKKADALFLQQLPGGPHHRDGHGKKPHRHDQHDQKAASKAAPDAAGSQ